MTTTPTIGAACPPCGESVEDLDTELGNAVVAAFTERHADHHTLAPALADAVEAVLDGYGKSGQGARMAHLADALHAYRAVNR